MGNSLIIDDREQQSGIVEIFYNLGVGVVIKRLSLGDYLIDDTVLFERKTIADFASSIIDGRLFKQAGQLASSKYKHAILLEGDRFSAEALNISREAFQGALITISLIYGIPVLRSRNLEETARLILYASNQINYCAKGSFIRKAKSPKFKRKLQLHILQGLPNVGLYRAQQLLEHFGSIEKVITADLDKLIVVRGIGKDTESKIRNAVMS